MSNSTQVKSFCEEYLSTSNNEEITTKQLEKLSSIIRSSEKYQKEIFIQLSEKGLNKLLNGMRDINSEVRKLSAKVMIDLISNNEILQNIFCEKFNFNPIGSVICINWVPKFFKEIISIDESLLNDIKNSFNSTRTNKYWMYPANSTYNDENFPDPQKYFLGFYYSSKNNSFNFEIKTNKKIDQNELSNKLEKFYVEEKNNQTEDY